MAWFIEKTMRFRFKFSDFDLYISILTIFISKWPTVVHNDTSHTIWSACYIPHCSITTGVVCNAEHFNYIWYLHQYLLSSITTLGTGELRHLTGMNMPYFTSHTFCSNGGRFGHLIKQVLSPIDMWLALIRCSSCR